MGDDGWRRSDAWIFVSLVIAGGAGRHHRAASTRRPEGVRLADVLSTANHLKKVIPARDEVESAVRRLAGAGLVSVTDGWFQVTAAGEQLWRTRPHGGFGTAVDTVHGVLTRRHTPGHTEWKLAEDEHATAVREYAARTIFPNQRQASENGRS